MKITKMILTGLKFFHSFISLFLRSGKDSKRILEKKSNLIKNYLHTFGDHKSPPSALCLRRAYSINKRRFSSSLGPLILLAEKKDTFSFALLYCAHTANNIAGNTFSFSRLHHAEGFKARKHHSFPESHFYDLAVAHTTLTKEFCASHLTRSKIKSINSANIGDDVRIISITGPSGEVIGKIKAVNDASSRMIHNPLYGDLIQLDILGIPGDSGSPVLTGDNEVIGLIVRTDEQGYSYCNKLFESKELFYQLYKKTKHKVDMNEIYLITL